MERPPVSVQARRRERVREWRRELENAVDEVWDSERITDRKLMVVITYFFDETPIDVDNIPKPILDALKVKVFSDDSQVYELLCRKRSRADNLSIVRPSRELLDALGNSRQVLHVSVSEVESLEVVF